MDGKESEFTNRRKGKAPERLSISEVQVHGRKRRKVSSPKNSSTGIFPVDIWLAIADFIPDTETLSVLSRVSKTLYRNLSSRIYRDLIVTAPSSRNFPACIKTLERYVSTSQLQSLRTIDSNPVLHGLVDPEAPSHPETVDPTLVPNCARYVRRLLVGWSNPGPERVGSISKYLEEALGNLINLEILVWLDNCIEFTDAIGLRLAKLNLKAFVFNFSCPRGPSSLSGIKNLVYLDILRSSDGSGIRELLWESKDTLQTLIHEEGHVSEGAQIDSLRDLLHDGEIIKLPKLTTLCLKLNRLTLPEANGLLSSIDFSRLTYFEFSTSKHVEGENEKTEEGFSHHALFKVLYDAYGPNSESGRLMLKTFRFRSRVPVYPSKFFLGLLSSFDTLRTFVFEETADNPGDEEKEDVDELLSALSSHKNLEWLAIHVPQYPEQRWRFSLDNFIKLRDCFPGLKHLACSYVKASRVALPKTTHDIHSPISHHANDTDGDTQEEQTKEIFSVLPNMKNLVSFALPGIRRTAGWMGSTPEIQMNVIVQEILPEYLKHLRLCPEGERRWEGKYKLSMLTMGNMSYELASGLYKGNPQNLPHRLHCHNHHDKGQTEKGTEFKTEGVFNTVNVKRVMPQQLFNGDYPNVNFMKAVEWRARNYDGTKGDWLQGIKL
ncbi:hypothetical protein TWF481_001521 [Arthrobotrys musiformis]|uniref:F-box domain-containing protein n=1 Tax=Arthrobotrys musiformis TaxID=47236 RepID=A0AAV9WQU6_9PEZI